LAATVGAYQFEHGAVALSLEVAESAED
jgi:hypothetical protein